MKKYIVKSLLVISSLTIFSCENYLEEVAISDVSASTYYTTPQGLEDATKATYGILKQYYGQEMGFSMTVFGTDTYTNGADGSHKYLNLYDASHSSAAAFFRDTWQIFYRAINQANAVLNRAQSIEGMDAATLNARLAEVRFIRALSYFNLVRFYGDVHLTLEETEGVETTANRTSVKEIYSQAIIPDLEFAVANLPATQGEYGRVTKGAAEFLLGHAALTNGDFGKAVSALSNVINNYGYKLLPTYGDLWELTNQKNSEIIWTIINSKQQVDEGLDPYGHRGHLYFLFEYDVQPGMTRDTENGRPWKRFRPTDYLLSRWDRTKDRRYYESFKHVWYSNKPISGKIALGDTALFIPGPGIMENGVDADTYGASLKSSKPYQTYLTNVYNQRIFPSLNKWIDPTRPNRQHEMGQRDFILMRLGDAYLLRAEAYWRQGNNAAAADDINKIRTRAAWPGKEAEMQITAADVSEDFILDERARELVGEGQRWFDLARFGNLVSRVKKYNMDAAVNIKEHHKLRPIPLQQIDRTDGGYSQNPGYTQ